MMSSHMPAAPSNSRSEILSMVSHMLRVVGQTLGVVSADALREGGLIHRFTELSAVDIDGNNVDFSKYSGKVHDGPRPNKPRAGQSKSCRFRWLSTLRPNEV